jgi:MurNAc alpha-1-phosphate uridylyltransferase
MDSLGALKRRAEMTLAPFVWTGVQIVHPRLFDGAPKGKFSINPLWDRAIDKGRLFGIRLDGVWIHVGSPQALEEAEGFLRDLARTP